MGKKVEVVIRDFRRAMRVAKCPECPDCGVRYSIKYWNNGQRTELQCPLTDTHDIYKYKNSFHGQVNDSLMESRNKLINMLSQKYDYLTPEHELGEL